MNKLILIALVCGVALSAWTPSWEGYTSKDFTADTGVIVKVGLKYTDATTLRAAFKATGQAAVGVFWVGWSDSAALADKNWAASTKVLKINRGAVTTETQFTECTAIAKTQADTTASTTAVFRVSCPTTATTEWALVDTTEASKTTKWTAAVSPALETADLEIKKTVTATADRLKTVHFQVAYTASSPTADTSNTGSTQYVIDTATAKFNTADTVGVTVNQYTAPTNNNSSSYSALSLLSWMALLISMIALN
jgi:hypothetical protein